MKALFLVALVALAPSARADIVTDWNAKALVIMIAERSPGEVGNAVWRKVGEYALEHYLQAR